jgi:hypothetical protein
MRKFFLIIVTLLFIYSNVNARLGLDFGLSGNFLSWDDYKYKEESILSAGFGFHIGLFYKYQDQNNEKLSLKVGVNYSMSNFSYDEEIPYFCFETIDSISKHTIGTEYVDGTKKIGTIQFPILINYFIRKELYIIAGMTTVIEISGEYEDNREDEGTIFYYFDFFPYIISESYDDYTKDSGDYKDDYLEADAYLTLGVGWKKKRINPEIKLNINLSPYRGGGFGENFDQFSLVFSCSIEL